MFEYHQNIFVVHASFLIDNDIITLANCCKMCQRNKMNRVQEGGNGRPALIEYKSIPMRFRHQIEQIVGTDPHKLVTKSGFDDYLMADQAAIDFFNKYTFDYDCALPEPSIKQYIAEATIFNALHKYIPKLLGVRRRLGGTTKIWEQLSEKIQNLPLHTYPHKLPKNPRSLKNKYNLYKKHSYKSLIHSGFGNKNSEKLNDLSKNWILARWSDNVKKVTSCMQLLHEYNAKAVHEGWDKLKDDKTIYNFLHTEEIKRIWWGARYGELKAKEKFAYQFSTKLPTMRDSLWYADGTKLNYYYLNDEGKISTCQVYEVIDAYSEVFLGYHISPTEDYKAQYSAFKMAIQIAGHKPYQIGVDNQGGHKKLQTENFLSQITHLAVRTQPYNGKSKTIESAFGRFQEHYMKRDFGFTGQNIQAVKLESKANMQQIMANKHLLPTLAEVKEIYAQRRKEWNEAPHPKTKVPRIDMYLNSTNPETPEFTFLDMVNVFWLWREKPVTLSAYGLTLTDQGVKHTYMVHHENGLPNQDWLSKNIDKKFYIKYDPDDMSMIYLYEDTPIGKRFVAEATPKLQIARNIQEQDEFDRKYYEAVALKIKEQRIRHAEQAEEIKRQFGMDNESYGFNTPAIAGITSAKKQKKQKQANKLTPVSSGAYEKALSNLTPIDLDNDEDEVWDLI